MYKKLNEIVKQYNKIIILSHISPDGDAFGSSWGLKEILSDKFPKKDIQVDLDDKKSDMTNFFPHSSTLKKAHYDGALIIVLDSAIKNRIASYSIHHAKEVVKIDHHLSTEAYGDLNFVNKKASSTCEIVVQIANELEWEISKVAAKWLYTGLVTDTGRFMHPSTTQTTFEIAGQLISKGIDTRQMYTSLSAKPLNQVKMNGYVQSKQKQINNLSYFIMPKRTYKKFGVPFEQSSGLVFTLMFSSDTKYGFYAIWDEKNKWYKGSIRSKGVPINEIAERYDGGGHKLACGVKLKNKAEIKSLIKELSEL